MNIFLEMFLTLFKIGMFPFGADSPLLPFIGPKVPGPTWLEGEATINSFGVGQPTPCP